MYMLSYQSNIVIKCLNFGVINKYNYYRLVINWKIAENVFKKKITEFKIILIIEMRNIVLLVQFAYRILRFSMQILLSCFSECNNRMKSFEWSGMSTYLVCIK